MSDSTPPAPEPGIDPTQAKVRQALKLVCSSLPHLSGLANAVQIIPDRRVPTAGITQTGRLFVNPDWFGRLDYADATFIAAHELLHLCLETHERGRGTDDELFNWAHDYVINDILVQELDRPVPSNGLAHAGARLLSAEKVVSMLRNGHLPGPRPARKSAMTRALEDAGLIPEMPPDLGPGCGDVLSDGMERRLVPGADASRDQRMRERIKKIATKAAGLGLLKRRVDESLEQGGVDPGAAGSDVALTEALRSAYQPPWELALQQWMEAVAPGPRTYSRPSRRGSDRADLVLAGRSRVGWALHVVLDTSGSMIDEIPRILGIIGSFCAAVGVAAVHVLQCDVTVTQDEWIEPEALGRYAVAGFGGSDMTPAMERLADDPEVEAAIVLTDGCIAYPPQPMPYQVLWAVTDDPSIDAFEPGYGHVLHLPPHIRSE